MHAFFMLRTIHSCNLGNQVARVCLQMMLLSARYCFIKIVTDDGDGPVSVVSTVLHRPCLLWQARKSGNWVITDHCFEKLTSTEEDAFGRICRETRLWTWIVKLQPKRIRLCECRDTGYCGSPRFMWDIGHFEPLWTNQPREASGVIPWSAALGGADIIVTSVWVLVRLVQFWFACCYWPRWFPLRSSVCGWLKKRSTHAPKLLGQFGNEQLSSYMKFNTWSHQQCLWDDIASRPSPNSWGVWCPLHDGTCWDSAHKASMHRRFVWQQWLQWLQWLRKCVEHTFPTRH